MTIETSGNRISYAGNGVTLAFSFPYPFVEKTDLLVIIVNDTTSVESVQTYTTDYSVTGEGTIDSGQVTMVTAPATGETLVLVRAQEYTQPSELPENDPLPSATIEQQLDRNTIMSLQLLDLVSRSLKLSDGDTSGANLTLPVLAASKLLQVRSDGLGFQFANAADLSLSTVSAYIDTLLDDPDSMTARGTLELGGKWNLTATTNPGTGDDSDDNYDVGSVWINVSENLAWVCFDATVGAAVWKQIEFDLPLTTQGDLLVHGASVLERLAIGSDGYYLASNGTDLEYRLGAEEVVQTWTFSTAVSAIDFESGFDDGYDHEFILRNIAPDSTDFLTYIVKEGGTYINTSNAYRYGIVTHIAATPSSAAGQSTAGYAGNGNIATGEKHSGKLFFYNPAGADATNSVAINQAAAAASATSLKAALTVSEREAAAVCQGIRFGWASGNNFASGSITHIRRRVF